MDGIKRCVLNLASRGPAEEVVQRMAHLGAVEANYLNNIQSQRLSAQYLKVAEAAESVSQELKLAYQFVNSLCSKFVHPTALTVHTIL